MIHLQRLRFAHVPGADVLAIDDYAVAPGDDVLVAGPSGCGKTTLLHLIAGLLSASAGRVIVDGQDLALLSPAQRDRFRGRRIGIVLQQFHLLPTLTVLQNLLLARSVAGLPPERAAAHSMLAALGVAGRAGAFPHQLSVGQQQRVAIARALVNRPQVVLADEPTSNLDDDACAAVAGLLRDAAREHGASLVIATHDSRLRALFPLQLALPPHPAALAATAA